MTTSSGWRVLRPIRWSLVALLLAAALPALAAPLAGEVVPIRQPDGSVLDVRVWGDEFYAVGETLDGYTVVKDPVTGMLCYAVLSQDGRDLISTGVPAGSSPRGLVLTKHVRISQEAASEKAISVRADFEKRAQEGPLAPKRTGVRGPTTGEVQGITLIVDFSDDPATLPASEIDNFCNLVGYSDYGNNGSVHDYYYDVSNGLLDYTNYVPVSYYRASKTKAYYTDPSAPFGQRARELIVEALTAMDDDGFDFSQYDANGDGVIDALNCFYAGGIWNDWAEGLWPHSWTVDFCADGVCTYKYQISNIGSQLKIGTFCHENGHMLMGWPDLYDYDYDSTGDGDYCIMAYGGSGGNPVQPCAYLKATAGWANLTVLTEAQGGVSVPDTGNVVYKFRRTGHNDEYYLIENRQKTGRDAGLPDQGLAIWHIDTNGDNSNQQMTPSLHYLVTLVQADGRWDLENNRNYGDATDLYAAPTYTDCTPETNPNTDWWDGSQSSLAFTNVGLSGSTMTFDFGDAPPSRPEGVVAAAGELSVSLHWHPVAATDLDHYSIERDTTGLFSGSVSSFTTADTSYVDYPLTGGTEYFYRVFAVDEADQSSPASDTVSAVPLADAAPATPTGLLALGGGGVIELRWDANPEPDVSAYIVERDTTTAFAHPETLGLPSASPFIDDTAAAGRGFWYRLTAGDATGHLSGPTDPVAGVAVSGEGIYVDASNPSAQNGSLSFPYRSIQAGIGAASSGDVVIVFPGTYDEALTLKAGVSLVGMRGRDVTTVTAGVAGVAIVAPVVMKAVAVDGLGTVSTGLDLSACDLAIEDCTFRNVAGSGVNCHNASSPRISRSSFEGNQSGVYSADTSAPVLRSNVFAGNTFANLLTFSSPALVVGGSLEWANDFLDHGSYMIMNGGGAEVSAEYNYWGDDCVDPGWFSGSVDYIPWTDETHTSEFQDCGSGVGGEEIPLAPYVTRSYPNPANPGTTIAFGLPEPGGDVSLRVYDASGRLVRTLLDGSVAAGRHVAYWDGRDDRGALVSSGVYFYRLEGPGFASEGKTTILK
jgi:M6 family metalloprotease-like protein